MRKLLIFLMIAIPLVVIFIVNVTVDAVAGIVIVPVDNISISCGAGVNAVYDEKNNLSQISITDISKTVKLSPKIYPESASNKEVYWESSNEEIAVVDNYGNVTFLSFGTVNIYAISGDKTKKSSCLFIVTDTRVHDIKIYSETTKIEVGSTVNVWARVFPNTALNQNYTLISSNPNVITINEAGVATAVSMGEATIIATAEDGSVGYNCTASLTIQVVKSVHNIKISPEEENLTLVTNKIKLTSIISPTDATNKNVKYTTTDPLTATVSNDGEVIFLKTGEVVITVITEDGGLTDSINLKYTGGYPTQLGNTYIKDLNTNIEILLDKNNSNQIVEANVSNGIAYKQIEYSLIPQNPSIVNINFYSTNTSVATVDNNGLVSVIGGGSAVIYISLQIKENSENMYEQYSIGINSERKINSISFISNDITTAIDTYNIIPIFAPSDATDTNNLSYSIISGNCATVSDLGVVSFISAGQIVIKIQDNSPLQTQNVYATITIKYTGGYPSDVLLDLENIELYVGQSNFINYTLSPIGTTIGRHYLEIYSQSPIVNSNEVISLDSNGKITALNSGSATIKIYAEIAENQWISKTCTITVYRDISKITLHCNEEIYEEKYISANNTFNFTTDIFPADATNTDLVYVLSNTDIATIINNNQIHFNKAGVVTLTVRSLKNNNIKDTITFWYTGNCAVNAQVNGIPEKDIVNGDDAFVITLNNVVPANATNKSFRINLSNNYTFLTSYNEAKTEATLSIINSGNVTLSLLLANSDGSFTILMTKEITVLQKVESISFPYSEQTISSTQLNLQCEIIPVNATKNDITYSLGEGYKSLAQINGSLLIFNQSANESETVLVIATLIDVDGIEKTSQMFITTTFGKINSPEGNSVDLSIGNTVEYDFTNDITDSTEINISSISGENNISYSFIENKLSITALNYGKSEVKVQLLNKITNELISINIEINIIIDIENIEISSPSLTKSGNKYVTAQNNTNLIINLTPKEASKDGLAISISDDSVATFDINTGILHFLNPGTIELTISSSNGNCSRSFIIQYTNGKSISYNINIENETSFYVTQNYLVKLNSYIPTNVNLSILDVNEIISSGSSSGIERSISENGIYIRFIKSGNIKLKITLSDGNEKIVSLNVTSSLSEILFQNEKITTALTNITLSPVLLPASATDKTLIYTSNDTNIATVDSNGLVSFIKSGTVIITVKSASNHSVSANCEITSTMGDVSEFTTNYSNISLSVGETRNLIVTSYLPANATNTTFKYEIVSSVSNDGSLDCVVSINGNSIKCLKGGIAVVKIYITTQNGEIYKLCTINVIRELTNVSISFNKPVDIYQNYYITSLNELDLIVSVFPVDATINSSSLTVDNTDIAYIENGKLTFVKEGFVKITAQYNSKTSIITVRYTKSAVSFELDEPAATINGIKEVSIYVGNTYQVKIKNIIPSDLTEKQITLTLYINSSNYNNNTVSLFNGNTLTGQNGGYSIYTISACGLTLSEKLKVNVIRLASSISTESNIITSNSIYPLAATVLPYDTTDKSLKFSVVDASNIASVDAYGNVVFTTEGTVIIEIKNEASGITKIITIKFDMGAKQIIFENSIKYVFIGNTLTLITKITPSQSRYEEIFWSVSDTNLATISSTGVLSPKITEGTVTVTARLRNYPETVANINIEIYANVYTLVLDLDNNEDSDCGILGKRVFGIYSVNGSIMNTQGDITKYFTNTMRLSFRSLTSNTLNPKLIWTSSDETIATVSNGVLTILSAGVVTITCAPAKQFYSEASNYLSDSYTFTFVEGINLETSDMFSKWSSMSINYSCYSDDNIKNSKEELRNLLILSKYYSSLAGVLQEDLTLNSANNKLINKDLHGNGHMLNLNYNSEYSGQFSIRKSVTINNVYFRGYTFKAGDSLTALKEYSSLVAVSHEGNGEAFNVVFKNCILDGAKRCVSVSNTTVTFSGCIIKNSYDGGITVESIDSSKPRTIVYVNNTIIENCFFGCILSIADSIYSKPNEYPLVVLGGKVYMFNWQDVSQYGDMTLEDDFAVFNSYLKDQINFALNSYAYKFKIVNGKKYAHFGILSPELKFDIGVASKDLHYYLNVVNNSSFSYSKDIYTNTIAVGSYVVTNWGLNSSSPNSKMSEPGSTYTTDVKFYQNEIRDLT